MSNQDNLEPQRISPFEAIRRENEQGNEYWSARELGKILGYATNYRNFQKAIQKGEEACKNSGQAVSDHFAFVRNMIRVGKGAKREVEDMHLSRYACYLVVQNADPSKPLVSLGQTYFAVQTRRAEIADELEELPEDQLRLIRRSQMSVLNTQLAESAQSAGVVTSKDFGIFQDHGYRGLYGGESARQIKARKSIARNEDILDWMNSDELAANSFRASLARQKIEREQIKGKEKANQAHHKMGQAVRKTIIETGATLPEEMTTPDKSVRQLQSEEQRRIEQRLQPSLFTEGEDSKNKE